MKCLRLILPTLLACCLMVLSGCGEPPELRVYEADPAIKPVTFNTPRGWYRVNVDARSRSFGELYAWEAHEGRRTARITVSLTGATDFDLLENVNRWRRQVGLLKPIEEDELRPIVQPLEVDGQTLQYVELLGPENMKDAKKAIAPARQAIWGAIFTAKDQTWFLKFRGPLELAQREKRTFKSWIPDAYRALVHAAREPQKKKETSDGD